MEQKDRHAPINLNPEEFREIGFKLINHIVNTMDSLPKKKVTTGETPSEIRKLLGDLSVPINGQDIKQLIEEMLSLIFGHSLFTGHPKYLGYITSSSSPIGALSEMVAATLNPNVAAWALSPVASEMEKQTIRWIAEMIGYPNDCGGILVSGGNMANFHCYLTARQAKANFDIVKKGINSTGPDKLLVYTSTETHLWLHKAAALFGSGTDSIRWIEVDNELKIKTNLLRKQIKNDLKEGFEPFMIVGTAGSVGTGAVDPLLEMYSICHEFDLWFHIDGAYGAFASMIPDSHIDFKAIKYADSIALDPHKWLYAPLEAGCTLVRDKNKLKNTFSYHPSYYKFDQVKGEEVESFFDYGMQNSRGFRALKVWMGIKQVGKIGYQKMILDDIELSKELYHLADKHLELEAVSNSLSITTFRFVPKNCESSQIVDEKYLNELNKRLLTVLQESGKAFVSNAIVHEKYVLRACFVNFRTSIKDVKEIIEIIVNLGRKIDNELRTTK